MTADKNANAILAALKGYLRRKLPAVLAFLLFACIFACVFFLYDLQAEAVFYASGLCALAGLVFLILGFVRYYKRHRRLARVLDCVTLLADQLPEPDDLLETDYQNMVHALLQVNSRNLTAWQSQRSESLDYYTTWVHQIKTPIAVMRMILQGEDTEEHGELLGELFRIEQYVEMVLSYFRLDSASSDFVFQPYALDGIIKQAVRKYAGQFVRKRIRLVYKGTDAVVLTDEKWLGFMIEQLLSNAVKYTERGEVTISVYNKVLSIADTGIGIAPEDLPRIFEKGFTGYNGRANKKSTGLGLYLCKQAADRLSHRLIARSVPGEGTTVSIDLRRAELEVE